MNDQEVLKAQEEFNQALRTLRDKVGECVYNARMATSKLQEVLSSTNLRSTITMLESDIVLRKQLEHFKFN